MYILPIFLLSNDWSNFMLDSISICNMRIPLYCKIQKLILYYNML